MAASDRRDPPDLAARLLDEPYRFEFAEAVRLLERLAGGPSSIGRDAPGREAVRFVVDQSLGFPASAIVDLRRPVLDPDADADADAPVGPAEMTVAFFGLTGPSGVLPAFYTTHLRQALRGGDRSSAAFFDLFNHRLISLFFRAGEKYRVVKDEGGGPERGDLAEALLHLIGLGGPSLRGRAGIDDRRLLLASPLLARRVRTAEGLAALLETTLGRAVAVEQFVARWVEIEPGLRSRLGRTGANNELGTSLLIGRRYRDAQGKFRLRIGPLDFPAFRSLLPGTPAFSELVDLTRLYVGPEFDFDVALILRAADVPRSLLSTGSPTARIGRHAWLRAGPAGADAAVVFASGASA